MFSQVSFQEHTIVDNSKIINGPQSVYSSDLDGDGDMDLISASVEDDKIVWYPNSNGSGLFNSEILVSDKADGANFVLALDIDGDNDMDLISTSSDDNKIAWYENLDGKGNFSDENIISLNLTGLRKIFGQDLDSDGDIDIISASFNDDRVVWYENLDGKGDFSEEMVVTEAVDGPIDFYSYDLDSDGDNDILLASARDGNVQWFENSDGKGSFGEKRIINNLNSPSSVFPSDLDNDGDLDIIIISAESNTIYWLKNLDGKGAFSDRIIIPSNPEIATGLYSNDIDYDGDNDIVASGYGFVVWFENADSEGNFNAPVYINKKLPGSNKAVFSDIDGDGYHDIITGSTIGDFIGWQQNIEGSGSFSYPQYVYDNAVGPYSVGSVDLDKDGDLDVLATSANESKIFWYENIDGAMNLSGQNIISTNALGNYAIAADMDNDGDEDVLIYSLNPASDSIEWYENLDGKGNYSKTPKTLEDTGDIANVNYSFGRSIDPADVDNDGDLDLLSTHYSFSAYTFDQIEWFENLDGNGNFGSPNTISARTDNRNDDGAERLTSSDIDGDGDIDLVCAFRVKDRVAWYENLDGKGGFSPQKIIADGQDGADEIRSEDMDGDGDNDVVFVSKMGEKLSWCENINGLGEFSEPIVLFQTKSYRSARHIDIDDIDNDGDLDILMVAYNGIVSWFENRGKGSFSSENIITEGISGTAFGSIGDMDGDGDSDIIISNLINNSILWFENLGKAASIVKGNVSFDIDSNGCDPLDLNLEDIMVTMTSSSNKFSVFTDARGNFEIFPNSGIFTTAITSGLSDIYAINPVTKELDLQTDQGTVEGVDFCITQNGTFNDVAINVYPIYVPQPGFEATYGLTFQNLGNIESSGSVHFEFDASKLSFVDASEVFALIEGNLKFDYSNLKPFESRTIFLEFGVFAPPVVNIDDFLSFTAEIVPDKPEDARDNNIHSFDQEVIGSFDPNDITVLEGDQINKEESRNYLNYVIRFQNTGTAPATNVRVEHELNENLDWTTFKPISSSHSDRITIKDERFVEFIFENINLPDSISNEKESHGYIAFKIKLKADIVIGDVITAQADIYFDYNLPVITNEVSTTVIDDSTDDFSAQVITKTEISCSGSNNGEVEVDITGGTAPYQYELFDDEDNLIKRSDNNSFTGLQAGNYNVKVYDSASNETVTNFEITEPPVLFAEISFIETSCKGLNDGEISITATGGTPPYEYSLDDQKYADNNIFPGLSSGDYEVWLKDSRGCIYSQVVTVLDPADEDLDSDGIGNLCDDDIDGDGILNENDECDDTVTGESINDKGCPIFTLPPSNFTVTGMSETCRSSNNGKIEITSDATYNYSASLVGTQTSTKKFTNTTEFENLEAGNYQLCITISDYPEYKQCFNIEISQPDVLEVNSAVNTANRTVLLELRGGDEYIITVNESVYRTRSEEIELSLDSDKNIISVSTELECQGSYSQQILLGSEVIIYPNPVTEGEVSIKLPGSNLQEQVVLELFSDNGKRIIHKQLHPQAGSIKLNLEGVVPGVYSVLIHSDGSLYYGRILRK